MFGQNIWQIKSKTANGGAVELDSAALVRSSAPACSAALAQPVRPLRRARPPAAWGRGGAPGAVRRGGCSIKCIAPMGQ